MAGAARALARKIGAHLASEKQSIATAESCTGGLISATITEIPGSSQWFKQGLITYSNECKQRLLDVSSSSLLAHGAVSEVVVNEMLMGALKTSGADVGIATSGIAGPGGGSDEKPVGTVWLAWGSIQAPVTKCIVFDGDRRKIRRKARIFALESCLKWLEARQGN